MTNNSILQADKTLNDFFIETVYKSLSNLLIPVLLVNLLILVCMIQTVHYSIGISWMIVANLTIIWRRKYIARIYESNLLDPKLKLTKIKNILLIGGIIQGIPGYFLPLFELDLRLLTCIFLWILCVGSLVYTYGFKPFFYYYCFPIMLSVLVGLAISCINEPNIYNIMWLTLHPFTTYLMVKIGDFLFNLVSESFFIRSEHSKLNRQLGEALESANFANMAKTRFLAAASHDLRQPLNTISIYLEALELQVMDDKSKTILYNIHRSQNILSNQLDSILDISKLDAGVVDLNFEVINVGDLLYRLITEFQILSAQNNISLSTDIDEDIFVDTDSLQLERILRNLISNAIKFTQNGSVVVKAKILADNKCALEIIDTGCGIDKSELDNIFQEFYQVDDDSQDRTLGLGLGLSIVKRLCEVLDVDISINSSIGQGTTVLLQLILSETQPDITLEHPSRVNFDIYHNLNILIVDDEESIREAMKTLLLQLKANIVTANGTNEAVLKVINWKPDLLLVDYRLKNSDNGIVAINSIHEIHSDLPAIIITGDIEKNSLLEIKKSGFPLLHKPYQLEHLTILVENILDPLSLANSN